MANAWRSLCGFGQMRRSVLVSRRLPRAETKSAASAPRTSSGRMLADYVSLHWSSGRPLVVWALASPPVGTSLRQAIYATRG